MPLPQPYPEAYPDEAKDALIFTYDPEQSFAAAEEEFGVPATLLKAVAHAESRGEHNSGYPNEHGGRGLMGLRHAAEQPMIESAAQLLGVKPREIILDPVQNIRAAAVLLRSYKNSSSESRSWAEAIALYNGRDESAAAAYVTEIRGILTQGVAAQTTGCLSIASGQAGLLDSTSANRSF